MKLKDHSIVGEERIGRRAKEVADEKGCGER